MSNISFSQEIKGELLSKAPTAVLIIDKQEVISHEQSKEKEYQQNKTISQLSVTPIKSNVILEKNSTKKKEPIEENLSKSKLYSTPQKENSIISN